MSWQDDDLMTFTIRKSPGEILEGKKWAEKEQQVLRNLIRDAHNYEKEPPQRPLTEEDLLNLEFEGSVCAGVYQPYVESGVSGVLVQNPATAKDVSLAELSKGLVQTGYPEDEEDLHDQIVLAAEDAKRAILDDIGFIPKAHAHVYFPHSQPQSMLAYQAQSLDRHWAFNISATIRLINGEEVSSGIPYGSIPRLLMSYFSTTAIKTKSPVVSLRGSVSGLMREIGIKCVDSRAKARFLWQLRAFLDANYSYVSSRKYHQLKVKKISIVKAYEFLNIDLIRSERFGEVELSDEFYHQLLELPVPIHYETLKRLQHNSLAMDIYCWATYRAFWMRRPDKHVLTWKNLHLYFGNSYGNNTKGHENFGKAFRDSLIWVKSFYPDLRIDVLRGGIIMHPSETHVPMICRR